MVHLESLQRRWKDRVAFAFIAVDEAGHRLPEYEFLLAPIKKDAADAYETRRARIAQALKVADTTLPTYVDRLDRKAEKAFSAWPARLIVVDDKGIIATDLGSPVAKRWDCSEVERTLQRLTGQESPTRPAAVSTD